MANGCTHPSRQHQQQHSEPATCATLRTTPCDLEVSGLELLGCLSEIDNPLNHSRSPHHKTCHAAGEHREQQHDQTRLGLTQHKFMDPEGPEQNSQ